MQLLIGFCIGVLFTFVASGIAFLYAVNEIEDSRRG